MASTLALDDLEERNLIGLLWLVRCHAYSGLLKLAACHECSSTHPTHRGALEFLLGISSTWQGPKAITFCSRAVPLGNEEFHELLLVLFWLDTGVT